MYFDSQRRVDNNDESSVNVPTYVGNDYTTQPTSPCLPDIHLYVWPGHNLIHMALASLAQSRLSHYYPNKIINIRNEINRYGIVIACLLVPLGQIQHVPSLRKS